MENLPFDVLCLMLKWLGRHMRAREVVELRLVCRKFLRGCDSPAVLLEWRSVNTDLLTWQVRTRKLVNFGLDNCDPLAWQFPRFSSPSAAALELIMYAVRQAVAYALRNPLPVPPAEFALFAKGSTVLREFKSAVGRVEAVWETSRYGVGLRDRALCLGMESGTFQQPTEDEDALSNFSDMVVSDEALQMEDELAVEDLALQEEMSDEEEDQFQYVRHMMEMDEDAMPSSFNFLHWGLSSLGQFYHQCRIENAMLVFDDWFEDIRRAILEDDGSLMNERCVVTGLTPLLCLYSSAGLFWTEFDCAPFLEKYVVPLTLLLLEKGADLNAVDRSGKGVFDFFVGENASFSATMWSNVVLASLRDKGICEPQNAFLRKRPLVGDGAAYQGDGESMLYRVEQPRVLASEFRDLMAGTDATEAEVAEIGSFLLVHLTHLMGAADYSRTMTLAGSASVLQVWHHFLGHFAGRRTL